MDTDDIFNESAKVAWAKSGNKVVKKYRCTSGKRKGRIVSSPQQCSAPIDIKKRLDTKRQMNKFGKKYARKTRKTKRVNPISKQIQKRNKMMAECFLSEGYIEQFDFNVAKATAKYAVISETMAKSIISKMPLGVYAEFVSALDNGNNEILDTLLDKYSQLITESVIFESIDDIEKMSMKDINNTSIFSEKSLVEAYITRTDYDNIIGEAFDVLSKLTEAELHNYVDTWLTEDHDYPKMLDVAILKNIYETVINPQLRTNVQQLAQKTMKIGAVPKFDDKTIVSADPKSKTVATNDDKGNVEIHKIDNQTKQKIQLEDIDIIRKLAGVKKDQ